MLDDDLWWAMVNYNYNYMYNNNRLGSGKAHQGHINHVISGQSKIVLYHVMLHEFILLVIYNLINLILVNSIITCFYSILNWLSEFIVTIITIDAI